MPCTLGPGRRVFAGRVWAVVAIAIVALTASIEAQILERSIVIRDATVITGRGFVIENGDVVIKKGEIVDVGRDVRAPLLSREIDGRGKTVTPGFIDIRGDLGLTATSSIARPQTSSADAFDRYATEEIRSALAQGVTAVYLPAGRAQGVHGLGSVIRLVPEKRTGAYGVIESREAALCVDLGANSTAVARTRTFRGVRKQFQSALDYRNSREQYQEALEEYEDKLEEYAKKVEKEESQGKKKSDDQKAVKGKLAPQKPTPRRGPAPRGKPGKDEKEESQKLEPPKKPSEVAVRADSVTILQALDREIPVRIEAHRSSDILNALLLAEEFRVRLVIEGATEAHLLADQIAEAKAVVVLTDLSDDRARGERELRVSAENGRTLRAAGVAVHVASASGRGASRFPLFNAQLAAARGIVSDPLAAVTIGAARFLDLDSKIGTLRKGRLADVVIWNGDPRDPASVVETVLVQGRVAYDKKEMGR